MLDIRRARQKDDYVLVMAAGVRASALLEVHLWHEAGLWRVLVLEWPCGGQATSCSSKHEHRSCGVRSLKPRATRAVTRTMSTPTIHALLRAFGFDRTEQVIATGTLADALREAAAGQDADERPTLPPPSH